MADHTPIEWTDATWNPITGCTLVSAGCTNCYAARLAATRLRNHPSRKGLARLNAAGVAKFTGEVRFNEQWLDQPLRWQRPRRVFVCAHGDLFHEDVPDQWIDKVFAVMALAPQHTFQVLTKRPERMREYLTTQLREHRIVNAQVQLPFPIPSPGIWPHLPMTNVWLGTSAEDQAAADARIPHLLATPAAVRFVSAEPLLGPLDLNNVCRSQGEYIDALWCEETPEDDPLFGGATIKWVIAGGESGPDARPMHPDWARGLRDQCAEAGVAFHFKQWGEWAPQVGAVSGWTIDDDPEISRFDHVDWQDDGTVGEPYRPMWCDDLEDDTMSRIGKSRAGRLLDGIEHNAMPEVPHG